jgi:hypothetical protein
MEDICPFYHLKNFSRLTTIDEKKPQTKVRGSTFKTDYWTLSVIAWATIFIRRLHRFSQIFLLKIPNLCNLRNLRIISDNVY